MTYEKPHAPHIPHAASKEVLRAERAVGFVASDFPYRKYKEGRQPQPDTNSSSMS
eukprot:CAMPEP_0171729986 /NCGR_PEP_ID=MMETSP0991-20121206/27981_1 /TAXON_ID=483369 /ORGANISM="non described non described, Strain CCMP2098" /LENGTH=54 /DNA_ID=CAMNT_0012324551 /DNA_START=1 /DNA_END=162 /DNA_ORIENTATION=+